MKGKVFLVIMLAALLLSACSLSPANLDQDQSVIQTEVEDQLKTQTATEQVVEEVATEPAAEYPAKADCIELELLLGNHISLDREIGPARFSGLGNGVNGDGCQLTAVGRGDQIADWGGKTNNFVNAMEAAGWQIDPNFSAGGAGAEAHTFRRNDNACMYTAEARPEDPSLCSSNEPLAVCLDRLNPSYVVYEIKIGCTPDSYVAAEKDVEEEDAGGDQEEASRIRFDPGAVSQVVSGKMQTLTAHRYILTAMQGQEMVVSLSTSPPLNGFVVIYGEDGTVLISDHAGAAFWSGILPSTQDYIISVRSSPYYPIAYTLEVIIPPVGETYTGTFQPMEFSICETMADLVHSAMGVEAQISYALFTDHISRLAGTGCQVASWGNWNQFVDRNAISTTIRNTLTANGWAEDQQYAAGGVGGFSTVFISGDTMCLYSERVSEMDPWVCDSYSGPITNCWDALEEWEMFFEIELNCATLK